MEMQIEFVHHIKRLSTHLSDARHLKRVVISSILEWDENNLPMLESKDLCGLRKLSMICGKSVRLGTLVRLKFINVEVCTELKCLFSRQLTLGLNNLEEISLRMCVHMEEVVEMEDENVDNEAKGHFSKFKETEVVRYASIKNHIQWGCCL